ncbi:hypothetical protein GT3570_16345 [Geobacillus thermoleovorans]|uniref:Uncharacterized protein n=1 Tax=Bacillus caldolyticus TaxID=1394 RepID=A0ABM6QNE9_BACCL|nr:hypothetical protein IB49_09230 [Geobacillus sp. LC300]AMV12477.1 hypothetical protein GT3570_16345 [Geobacillus thermoleovorans]AUI37031.1 hypothetical protein CWI35_11390 [[Bacillus] caldolyticus]EQB96193.1 hypothetical protein GA8_07610 [Geobacillus sp. A8]KDE46168.1 hypothetical protein DI44_17675 [Geobacillus sp. CAMR5420]KQC48028.1 hypothetical protein AP057_02310 [Geobacillus sp. Sah69]OQP15799.1 hypothetical protein B1693_11575 [Geobacillus zalihae]
MQGKSFRRCNGMLHPWVSIPLFVAARAKKNIDAEIPVGKGRKKRSGQERFPNLDAGWRARQQPRRQTGSAFTRP